MHERTHKRSMSSSSSKKADNAKTYDREKHIRAISLRSDASRLWGGDCWPVWGLFGPPAVDIGLFGVSEAFLGPYPTSPLGRERFSIPPLHFFQPPSSPSGRGLSLLPINKHPLPRPAGCQPGNTRRALRARLSSSQPQPWTRSQLRVCKHPQIVRT